MLFSLPGVIAAKRSGNSALAVKLATGLASMGHPDGPAALTVATMAGRGFGNLRGGGGAPSIGGGPGKVSRVPTSPYLPGDLRSPGPGDFPIITQGGRTAYAAMDAFGGGQPFPLVGFVSLAAGAQTQGTDLIDFHASASNPTIISINDLVLGNVEVFEASLYLGARLTVTLGFEGVAFLVGNAWLIEYINGIEKARWTPKALGCAISQVGIITSGGAANNYSLDVPSVPFHRKYDPNIKAKTAYQLGVTTTTVSAVDAGLVESGTRP